MQLTTRWQRWRSAICSMAQSFRRKHPETELRNTVMTVDKRQRRPQTLQGMTDGLHPVRTDRVYLQLNDRGHQVNADVPNDHPIVGMLAEDLRENFFDEESDVSPKRGEFWLADLFAHRPPSDGSKTNMVYNLLRQQVEQLPPEEREEYLKRYLSARGVSDEFDAKEFAERYKHLFAGSEVLDSIERLDTTGDAAPIVILDSHVPDPAVEALQRRHRPGRVLLVGAGLSLPVAALRKHLETGETLVMMDSESPPPVDMVAMLDKLHVCEPAPVTEKPWIEMNQPYGKRKKRARPGRKFKPKH
jgi:hypothetical protein